MPKRTRKLKVKQDDKVLVTFDLDDDSYFELLRYCVNSRRTLDDVVEAALQSFIEKHKHLVRKQRG
jgi:hypothetical protein